MNYKLSGKARKTARAILKAKANLRDVSSHHALLDFVNPRILNFFWSEEGYDSYVTQQRQTGRK